MLEQDQPVIWLGMWQDEAGELMDMSVTEWDDQKADEYAEKLRHRSEILVKVYAPLIWADEYVSGVEIVPDA